jgi:hypothetical protein
MNFTEILYLTLNNYQLINQSFFFSIFIRLSENCKRITGSEQNELTRSSEYNILPNTAIISSNTEKERLID